MTVRGTLGETSIADVFQRVSRESASGVIVFTSAQQAIRVSVVDGAVVKIEDAPREPAHLLGTLMVRGKAVSQAELDDALAQQQSAPRRLGEILVERGVVDPATVKLFARLQTQDAISRLFSWTAGTYEFLVQPVEAEIGAHEPLKIETLLMNALRMAEAWPALRIAIPSSSMVVTVSGTLPRTEGTDAHQRVASCVVTGRTVAEIIDAARLGEFETTKILAEWVSQGRVRVGRPSLVSGRFHNVGRRAALMGRTALVQWFFAGVMAVGLFFVVNLASTLPRGTMSLVFSESTVAAVQEAQATTQATRIADALSVHRVMRGVYPRSLDELVALKLLTPQDVTFPFASPWAYQKTQAGYALSRPLH
jgi:hypothetical protein